MSGDFLARHALRSRRSIMIRTALLVLVAAVAPLAGALPLAADALEAIRGAGKVRIAIDLAIPPFGMTDDKMQPTGSDVDLARLLAKDLGVALEIVPTTGPARIPALQADKADLVISTLSITPERARVVDFSVPYADHPSVVAALKSIAVKRYEDLDGRKVAVVRGTTQDIELQKVAKGAQLVRYEDDATMALAVASGQADILATARSLLAGINGKNPARAVEPKITMATYYLAIGLRKNEPQLLATVNGWVKANLRNGRLNAIFKSYHGFDVAPDVLKAGDE
jgi:polar amino acid transport system substrate-binding protein